ncbi:hypothetical protein AMTRI_Chr02g265130 [Amborella trichopoda]|uniref:Folate receptor-like domain-containing protein n=1 Tax=Amborella trichopoda TaxID=13333 RepID=W1NXD4_AMBTC|nr:uncharacterized protein LOC18430369 [Amborella trichopoda]ERN02262.1 hypothetical protein AMTR_s00045p00232400 [Amborella trichopoda]|eukprot:XP_006840587.1 uncharacterized protein LOC18430369 [Amborella trichopoda]
MKTYAKAPRFHGFPLFCFLLFGAITLGEPNRVCISQGGRFPPFSLEGKPPQKATKGPKDLALCRVFRAKTCCDIVQTYPALLSIRRLASSGEANPECLHLWEMLECSLCDPRVGVQRGPPVICKSFCDSVFQACSNAYFAIDGSTQVLSPCGSKDIVCGAATGWAKNGSEFCQLAGFSVHSLEDGSHGIEDSYCFGEKMGIDSVQDSWKKGYESTSTRKEEEMGFVQDFHQWIQQMPFRESVSWAVGGLVLTAGLMFMSKRKSYSCRQKQAALFRTARRLEAMANHNSPTQGSARRLRR